MKVDDNYRESKILAEDLSVLIDGFVTKDLLFIFKTLENLIIHDLVEQINKEDDPKGKDFEIVLPYLGSLVISVSDKNKLSTNFVVRNSFYHDLRKYYNKNESPLTEQYAKLLGEALSKKYEEEDPL